MKTEVMKIPIPYHEDRQRIVLGLANSGYKVWIEEEDESVATTLFTVCFEPKRVT